MCSTRRWRACTPGAAHPERPSDPRSRRAPEAPIASGRAGAGDRRLPHRRCQPAKGCSSWPRAGVTHVLGNDAHSSRAGRPVALSAALEALRTVPGKRCPTSSGSRASTMQGVSAGRARLSQRPRRSRRRDAAPVLGLGAGVRNTLARIGLPRGICAGCAPAHSRVLRSAFVTRRASRRDPPLRGEQGP